jgi:hypothetical protein
MWDFGWVLGVFWDKDLALFYFEDFFQERVSIGSVALYRKGSFYVERKTSMAYPGFEPEPLAQKSNVLTTVLSGTLLL